MDLINLIAEIIILGREGLILVCIYGCLALLLWACERHKVVNKLGGRERNG